MTQVRLGWSPRVGDLMLAVAGEGPSQAHISFLAQRLCLSTQACPALTS